MRLTPTLPWRSMLLVIALVLLGTACNGEDVDEEAEDPTGEDEETEQAEGTADDGDAAVEAAEAEPVDPADGGVILFGDAVEPTILNALLVDGGTLVTDKVFNNHFQGAYRITPSFEMEPELIEGAEVTEDPFTVTYTIRDEATWSDGEPITAEDFVFTYETLIDEQWRDQVLNPGPYLLIDEAEVIDDKTVSFAFSEPWGAWQELFQSVLPAHVLEGEDFATVMNDELPEVGSGPFLFESWDRGTQLRLVRNENYWDGEVEVNEIVMRYVPDTATLTQQMRGREIHMYDPQPQVEILEQLDGVSDRVNYEVGLGPVWEHIDFNTLVDGLDEPFVRQAIAMGINRQVLVEALLAPINPDGEVLDNPHYMANDERYEPAYDRWGHDPQAATSLLEDNGCEPGDDGVYVCGDTRLSFRIHTDAGNERRELAQQLIQSDLGDIGVEIEIDNDEGAAFAERLDTPENCDGVCDYDIALFAWAGSPNPTDNRNIYACDFEGEEPRPRPQNWTAWCDEEASALMDEAARTVDIERQTELWNQAAERMAEEVPILPLFQLPMLLAWDDSITGPQLNATNQTQFWNAAEWRITE